MFTRKKDLYVAHDSKLSIGLVAKLSSLFDMRIFTRMLLVLSVMVVSNVTVAQTYNLQPTNLATLQTKKSSQIIEHVGYTVSYNEQWHIPNWVAYELTDEEVQGTVPRKGNGNFIPDPLVSGVEIMSSDYSGSGYDRGHMAPAGDMKWSVQAMQESFYLSNICPQNPNLNSGDWRILEEKIRTWAGYYKSIYVVCGPLVDKNPKVIGTKNIAVPSAFFKVLLRVTDSGVETIGFIFPNQAGHKPLSSYMVPVDTIEQMTGIDFFSTLPGKLEKETEKSYCAECWK
ncbi:MAG: DNA/RNA non-specific endonuclease [Bacteroidales bacterium]|nr:DNA/RNA non-specific endonuclease [Bacteroidales bacterium]